MGLSHDVSSMVITVVVFMVVTSSFLAGRLYMRRRNHALGADDWLLVFALCADYLNSACALALALKGGLGKSFNTLTSDEVKTLLQTLWIIEIGYPLAVTSIKLSVLVSYRRIFERVEWLRWPIYSLGACSIAWLCTHLLFVIFQCTPVEKAWSPPIPGHCMDTKTVIWGHAIANSILDYLIVLLPIIPVWRLHMSIFHKVLLSGSLGLGLTACAASTIRPATGLLADTEDISRTMLFATIWIYVEPNAGIIAACLPMFTCVFAKRVRVKITKMRKNPEHKSTAGLNPLRPKAGTITRRDSFTVVRESGEPETSYELAEEGFSRAYTDPKRTGEPSSFTRHIV